MNQALNQFLQDREKRAYKTALIACGRHHDAMDIVQEAMLALLQYYSAKPAEQWPMLFNRILHNKINDWYRQQGLRRRLLDWWDGNRDDQEQTSSDDPIAQAAAPAQSAPDELCAHRQGIQSIEQALSQLPLRQRQAFLLRAWEGHSVREAAAAMQCTEGSVKTHYSRAIGKLKRLLDKEQPQ